MQMVVLFVVQGLCFAVLDAAMLTRVMQPLFRQQIGSLMLDGLRIGPAVGFYILYIAGLTLEECTSIVKAHRRSGSDIAGCPSLISRRLAISP